MVAVGLLFGNGLQSVGLFDMQRVGSRGTQGERETLAGDSHRGIEVGARGEIEVKRLSLHGSVFSDERSIRGESSAYTHVSEEFHERFIALRCVLGEPFQEEFTFVQRYPLVPESGG